MRKTAEEKRQQIRRRGIAEQLWSDESRRWALKAADLRMIIDYHGNSTARAGAAKLANAGTQKRQTLAEKSAIREARLVAEETLRAERKRWREKLRRLELKIRRLECGS